MICTCVLAGEWMDSVGCCAELRAAEEWQMLVYQWVDDEERLVPWDDENEQAVSFRIPKEVA